MEFTNTNIIKQQYTTQVKYQVYHAIPKNYHNTHYEIFLVSTTSELKRKRFQDIFKAEKKWNPHSSYWIGHLTSLCLLFLAIIYNFTFHTRSDFHLTMLRARRGPDLATDVFTAGLTWWTCHILTEILIERVLKTIFLLWPNWLFISPLIWPSIAIKMPAHLTEPALSVAFH